MEAALDKIGASLLIASDESGQPIYSIPPASDSPTSLANAGQRFVSLDKLSANLKMGPLTQTVVVKDNEVELSQHHPGPHAVSVVSAKSLDRAFLADSLAKDLVDRKSE